MQPTGFTTTAQESLTKYSTATAIQKLRLDGEYSSNESTQERTMPESSWQPGDPLYEWGYDGPSVMRKMIEIRDDVPNPHAAARWTPEHGWGPA